MARRKGADRSLKGGQRVELDVVTIAPSGDGIAEREDGTDVHVPGALPGEQVAARVGHRSRQIARAYASLEEVIAPSTSRRVAPCEHQGRCDGCPLMIADEPAQRRFKRAMLRETYRLDVDRMVHDAGAELGYRRSSKRVAGGTPGAVLLGSYRRRTHVVAGMRQCLVDGPTIAACARELEATARELEIAPYDEKSRHGLLRYALFKADGDGEVLTCLVLAASEPTAAAELAAGVPSAAGVSWCTQASVGNVLRGDQVEHLKGKQSLTVELAGVSAEVGPLGFLQPNPAVASLAYRDLVCTRAGEPLAGGHALDLFAGTGATTALLREQFERVTPSETFPESCAVLGIEPISATELLATLLDGSLEHRDVDAVVADPPRSGLGAELCAQLCELAPRRLHLMSCSGASLHRDLDHLLKPAGCFRLVGLRGYDTLPQTPHVELVAWLERR
ncbi:MAG: class I SAM-dependent RNA methyltransferase [Deltaproteobacteria bacterium]|nr:class I SAM-dependent RNA methyltransferase [Deltaproteobacteria bacterium]MBW2537363.1 class I SAM-dependent RNA methyltransferase [Deltaproteobacteria bacterium]